MTVYLPNIPLASDLLSKSQGNIRDNFTSANTTFGINHLAFDNATANIGKHKFVQMPAGSLPAGLISGEGTLYTKSSTGSQLYYSPDNTSNEYQITRTIASTFATFSQIPGWTFLPGGMLMQWGQVSTPGAGPSIVTFPVAFAAASSVYSIQLTARNDGSHSAFNYYVDGAPTTNNFTYRGTTSSSDTLFWMAIGK